MDERVKFISRLLEGDRMSDICKDFGISRKTGYKFRNRYLAHGVRGLVDNSKRPDFHPHKTPETIEKLIIKLRRIKPTWGPKKIRARLEIDHPDFKIPSTSTVDAILNRYGIIRQKSKRRRYKAESTGLLHQSYAPNDIWCVDFKGHYRLANKQYCYPLTITDHYSRFILGCEALENTSTGGAWSTFERVFQHYGLPKIIRSDNGAPFSARTINGWSQLSIWWLRLGIQLERIEPGHPEQNGRHERMHWTLKKEAVKPPSPNFFHQQARFDTFQNEFNYYRPHEALEMKIPSSLYKKSEIPYPKQLPEIDYPIHDIVSTVNKYGSISLKNGCSFHLSTALSGEDVGFREIEPKTWLINFMNYDLGYYNENTNLFHLKLSDLPPV